MIGSLARSRMRYNKSRTVLTIIAIMLTTTLLTSLGTSAMGLMDMNKQQAAAESNAHATIVNITGEQAEKLSNHLDIESLQLNEIFADIEYGKMNGFLTCSDEIKGGISYGTGNIIEGHAAEKKNEISGPKAFFERMNIKPEIGGKANISFRVQGKGKTEAREFTICGITSERDISGLDINDSRIVYSASVARELANEMIPDGEHVYNAVIRVYGESELNYDDICEKINDVAEDIGCSRNNVSINKDYLFTATDPGTDTVGVVAAIALLIVVFSGIVIYSIYYVGVITDVHEIGKLKALGASKKQIRGILLREGMTLAAVAIPAGLLVGFFIPYFLLPIVVEKGLEKSLLSFETGDIHMFSAPVMILAALAVLMTVYISLIKPMRMASGISPVEAMRYQESSQRIKSRRGNISVNVFRLSRANLIRNKKRTIVTMMTMGLSCILFMSLAGILNSMSADDIADRELEGSDFKISLDYDLNDDTYPENNLENINKNNPFSDDMLRGILTTKGVEDVRSVHSIPASSDYKSLLFEEGRISVSEFDRKKAEEYQGKIELGSIDYDRFISENGIVFTGAAFWDEYGLGLGDEIKLILYDGDRKIPFDAKIEAAVDDGNAASFVMPEELYDSLGLENNSITDIYIDVDERYYNEIKDKLTSVTDNGDRLKLYSRDEEKDIGSLSINMTKYPMYAILLLIAVIGFMNLVNTMITSMITRKRELGMLQAIGLSDRQMNRMLSGEGLVFTAGALVLALTFGNIFGYLIFLWGKDTGFMSVSRYHYPVAETVALTLLLLIGQLLITFFISRRMRKESLIDRIRSEE